MIEVKISSDMPLPMPRSVMSSPSHMMTAVPAVIVRTIVTMTQMRLVRDQVLAAALEQPPGLRARAIRPVDCRIARPTVR